MELNYRVVDVFTQTPLEGNALAVFTDGRGVNPQTMQRIARELNLAEITFILPASRNDCAAKVRIFTPTMEMLFAGHPTIGTSYVLRECGIVPPQEKSFVLEENVGPVKVRIDEGDDPLIWLQTPPISRGRTFGKREAAAAVALDERDLLTDVPVQVLSAGNPNVYVAVRDKAAVDRAWVDLSAQRALLGDSDPTCVFVFTPTPQGAYSRMFAPEHGVVEDPATGSATGPLAAYMIEHGLCAKGDGTHLISEQGVKMGRRSVLHILIHGANASGGIEVGGHVRPIATATMQV
jgi:trans-2,3-dihydro-3-hydroxyanthranilate isomerase